MLIKIKITILACLVVTAINAQNYTHSPYSKFGIGDLVQNGASNNLSMGGIGVSIRPQNQINYLNPASYTAQDTLTFILTTDIILRNSSLITSDLKENTKNFNLEYISIGFPINKWWKASSGITPYSRMEYHLYNENILNTDEEQASLEYTGNGGLNEFYLGSAFKINKNISIGFNVYYLFGTLVKDRLIKIGGSTISASTQFEEKTIVKDFHLRTGIQYFKHLSEKHFISVGLTYDPKAKINVDYSNLALRNFPSTSPVIVDTLNISQIDADYIEIPGRLGIGASYAFDERLTVGLDYIMQDWSKASVINNDYNLDKYQSFKFGMEFTPSSPLKMIRTNYWKRIHYQIGAYYTDTYMNVNGKKIINSGISAGLILPVKNYRNLYTGTSINISYQYGSRGTTSNGLIKENYHNFTLGLSLLDFWFIKPKYD